MQNYLTSKSFILSLFLLSLSAQSQTIVYQEGLFSKKFTVEAPADADGKSPDMYVVREANEAGHRITFATGRAIPRQKPETDQKEMTKHALLKFSDLQLLVDGRGQKVAAAYPLQQNRGIFIAALHALQNTQFENREMTEKKKWGLQDKVTGQLLDIAFMTHISDENELIAQLVKAFDWSDRISVGYTDHLNVVDSQGELILSRSVLQITSSNQNYIFFKNSPQSMVGYASSGAIIYNETNGLAQSIVICASRVPLNQDEKALRNRALKLESLKRFKLIELNEELINAFVNLPCDSQDSRRAGGP